MITLNHKTILITGVAGFIGMNLAKYIFLSQEDVRIVGIDNMNDYYDVSLKKHRLEQLEEIYKETKNNKFVFVEGDISDKAIISNLFEEYKPEIVVNLAAQAGVRYSIENPEAYINSNIIGFFNILEACRHSQNLEHLVYASSSSVYGANTKIPFSTDDKTDKPVSLYAATKKSNELLAYSYCKLYGIQATGLRFFTVYGPAGRPDMAYFGFTNKLRNNEKIKIFNYGNCQRDFTYIDDIVFGIAKVMEKVPSEDEAGVKHKVYNIGNNHPENLMVFVDILQKELAHVGVLPKDFDVKEHMELVPMQAGDVETTYADVSELEKDFSFKPQTSLTDGLRQFALWYKEYYMDAER